MRKANHPLVLVAAALLVLVVLISGAAAPSHVSTTSSTTSTSSSSPLQLFSAQALGGDSSGAKPWCNYTISQKGTTPVAGAHSRSETRTSGGTDMGAFLNTLLESHETLCVTSGIYTVDTEIRVNHLNGVTLIFDPGAVMKATSGNRLLFVYASAGTVIRGGEWMGPAGGEASVIRILHGSNNTVVERADISKAGWDGILIYQYVRPSFNVSILDNVIHDNGRYGVQMYSSTPVRMTGTVISGNVALDNQAGGIYANGAAGVTIIQNVVRNTEGNGPGVIGIGVTNAFNDTVTLNQVDHMAWFGIQAYYNNYTVISHNISTFNAGGWDESGITNDHSSHSTVVENVVESNGKFGVYVERSWNVTVRGNLANDNHGYGIGFYHGTLPTMGRGVILGNICSFNSLGGIILNSAIDNLISMNHCNNNSGDGILLFNDPGQAGSTGNVISNDWSGNEGRSPPTQMFGIREANDANSNTFISNVMVNNTVAAMSILGPDSRVSP